jgi:diguanylate cyclase (GGDEF)-like protein
VDRNLNPCALLGLALLLWLVCASLWAQEYSFHPFGNADGLSNLMVRRIYQDRVGFLWVSTENGVFRFDGKRFELFGLEKGLPPSSEVAFGDAPDGSLLVGGVIGLYQLRGSRFEKLVGAFKTVNWSQGIDSDGKGRTYLATDAGLMELDAVPGQSGFALHQLPRAAGSSTPAASAVLADGEILWYGCGQQLCRMDREGTRIFGQRNGLPGQPVMAIRKDHEGSLWVRTSQGSIFVLLVGQSRFRIPPPPVSNRPVSALSVDSEGRILLLSPSGFLVQEGRGWRLVDRSSGLRGAASAAIEDRQHVLWVGLDGRGLAQWRGYQQWESYSTESGLASDVVTEILPLGNTLWVGSLAGLSRGLRQGGAVRWSQVPGLQGFTVYAVRRAPDGELWLSTAQRGVARFSPKTGRIQWLGEAQGLLGKTVFSLLFDHQQRLWAGTNEGLFVSKPPYSRFGRNDDIPPALIWSITEDGDGVLWAGGEAGLFALVGGRWRSFSRATDGLSNQEVLSLGLDQGSGVWVGYRRGGIDRVRLTPGGFFVEKNVQRKGTDGLIYFIDRDAFGRMWVGTEHGVDLWEDGFWRHYDIGDGLVWNDCNLHAFAHDSDGSVWIGTSGGLSHFRPQRENGPDLPLKVVFTALLMGRRDLSTESATTFKTRSNSLIARFAVLNVSRENGVMFRYRMQGGNTPWTETEQSELLFAELAPGEYRLEVEVQDDDGVWSGQAARFVFRVLPPWYLSWWFLSLCGLFPLAGAWLVARLRMDNVARRERELQRLMKVHEEIRNLAYFDPLTGLPNRRLLLDRLAKVQAVGVCHGRLRALLFVDLDDFKTLNDTLGHAMGDILLQEVARRLTVTLCEADIVARLGGDEFAAMLEDLDQCPNTAAAQAGRVADKILRVLSQPYSLSGRECLSTASIGITVFGDRPVSGNEVLQQADIAISQAKGEGANTVHFFAPALQAAVNARAALADELRMAIKTEQFVLYYQPQVTRGVVTGVEALIRWRHPQHGLLAPSEFIPLAEETGLILPLGDWVLQATCEQAAAWARHPRTAMITVAANISARQMRQTDFVARVLRAVESSGANPHSLKLELTESMLVDNIDEVIAKMTELKEHGLRFSLDDFGTGYSSLNYLKRLPLNQLKIDRSFVHDILTSASSGAIAQAIISLSRALGISVMAEGVETEAQREFLASLGCHAYQGYLFSRPVCVEDFERILLQEEEKEQWTV